MEDNIICDGSIPSLDLEQPLTEIELSQLDIEQFYLFNKTKDINICVSSNYCKQKQSGYYEGRVLVGILEAYSMDKYRGWDNHSAERIITPRHKEIKEWLHRMKELYGLSDPRDEARSL